VRERGQAAAAAAEPAIGARSSRGDGGLSAVADRALLRSISWYGTVRQPVKLRSHSDIRSAADHDGPYSSKLGPRSSSTQHAASWHTRPQAATPTSRPQLIAKSRLFAVVGEGGKRQSGASCHRSASRATAPPLLWCEAPRSSSSGGGSSSSSSSSSGSSQVRKTGRTTCVATATGPPSEQGIHHSLACKF
jgi:hypothetical protein